MDGRKHFWNSPVLAVSRRCRLSRFSSDVDSLSTTTTLFRVRLLLVNTRTQQLIFPPNYLYGQKTKQKYQADVVQRVVTFKCALLNCLASITDRPFVGLWMKDSFRMFAPLAAAAWPLVSPGKFNKNQQLRLVRHLFWFFFFTFFFF